MGLKPHTTRWFEALAARDDLSRVAEALARSGVVQVESEEEAAEIVGSAELGTELSAFDALERRYHPYWPSAAAPAPGISGAPDEVARGALARIRAWSTEADPLIERLQRLEHERADLALLAELLRASGGDFPDPRSLRTAGPTLSAKLFVLTQSELDKLELPGRPLVRRILGEQHAFLLVVDQIPRAFELERALDAVKARPLELPNWIGSSIAEAQAEIERRSGALEADLGEIGLQLSAGHVAHQLAPAIGDLRRLRWFITSVPLLPRTRHFAIITGWTSDRDGGLLRAALAQSGVRALLHFPPAPAGRTPPVVLDNPSWVRPFETFPTLIGTPAEHESDPSPLLALIAPLLFGFMFGDVGQGAVLIAAGLILKKRWPVLRLLIPGGVAAIAFGFVFGSVFALDGVVPALWRHPFTAPLAILAASVLGGAAILLLGLVLGGLQARWGGAFETWLRTDAALIVTYLGLLGTLLDRRSALIAVAGVVWHLVGSGLVAQKHRIAATLSAAGHLIERMLQLLVNTVSFARVGAFALAHAGLSSAIAALAHATGHPASTAAVLILGNLLTLGLEGLVVSVQTTRLVLFEFFVRFLRGEGRAFRPLLPPPPFGPPATSPRS